MWEIENLNDLKQVFREQEQEQDKTAEELQKLKFEAIKARQELERERLKLNQEKAKAQQETQRQRLKLAQAKEQRAREQHEQRQKHAEKQAKNERTTFFISISFLFLNVFICFCVLLFVLCRY